jgi:hypothetical protein
MKYRDIYTAHANQVENNFSEIYKRSKNSLEKYIKNMNSAYPMAVQPKKLLYKVHDHEAFDEKKFTLNPKYTDNLYMPEMTKKSLQSLEDYLHKVVTKPKKHPQTQSFVFESPPAFINLAIKSSRLSVFRKHDTISLRPIMNCKMWLEFFSTKVKDSNYYNFCIFDFC